MLSAKLYQKKLFTLIGASMLGISMVVMLFGYFASKHSTKEKLEKSAFQELQLKKHILLSTINEAKTMMQQLKNSSVFELVQNKQALCPLGEQLFTALSHMYPPMKTLRFLDASSKEMFRIDKRESSHIRIQKFNTSQMPREECACYQATLLLPLNDIWISKIKHHTQTSEASLSLASRFFDEATQSFGIMVMEIDLDIVLQTLENSQLFEITLVNKDNAPIQPSPYSVQWQDGFLYASDRLITTNENTIELHLRSDANLSEILKGISEIFIIIFIITALLSYLLSFILSKLHMSMVAKINARENLLIQESKLVEIGSMSTYLTHQWKQPLNELATTILLVKKRLAQAKAPCSFLNESVNQCETIIDTMGENIDTFARFYRFSKNEEHFDVKNAIEQILPIVSNTLALHTITLSLQLEENITTYGYRNEYMHVILSLIHNSIEAFKHHPSLSERQLYIQLSLKEATICITIADNAGGIERSLVDTLFKKYATSKYNGSNSGLGLYFAKVIIEERFKGTITFQTNDQGTLFTITHPYTPQ